MAITAAGVGSGLDIETIVSQLMTLERQPLVNLERRESVVNAQISAYGRLRSSVSAFQDAMDNLGSLDKFRIFSSTSSNEDVATASTDSAAAAGIYDIDITRLAQNHKMASAEFASTDQFGGGVGDQLTLTVGVDAMAIDLETTPLTLTGIRDAINSASDNPGVTATILNTGGGNQRLILTANESGEAGQVQLGFSGTINNANSFQFATLNKNPDGSDMVNLANLDAEYSVDGFTVNSASNSATNVIDGISLELKQVGTAQINITRDTEAIEESAKEFVDAYNNVLSTIDSLRSGDLSGDSTLLSITGLMRNVLNTAPVGLTGAFDSLSQVGIKTNAETGKLELDSTDFAAALDTDFTSVAELFAHDDQGYAFRFSALADTFLDTDGVLDSRTDGLNDRVRSLQDSQDDMERRLELKERALRSQYAALDSLVGSLQNTSAFLLQQLG